MADKVIPIKKIVKVLKKYEEGALNQMKENKLQEADMLSEEMLGNFELVGATCQFMTVRDIANDLGILKYVVDE